MSVFSMLKRGRQAAKEHAAKQAEKEKKEAEQAPYKHVPRHACQDALAGGPASWREVDRPRIMEQNRRRSMMTASGVGMSGGTATPVHVGFPRINSALSHVSYPASSASPVVHMPRGYSYSGVPPGWSSHGGEVIYSPMDEIPYVPGKGKEVERILVDSGRASRTSSKVSFGPYPIERSATTGRVRNSPAGSSSNSTSSQDDLEMKAVKPGSAASPTTIGPSPPPNPPASGRPAGEGDYFHRLHPGKSRRISDPPSPNHYGYQARSFYVSPKHGGPRVVSLPATASGIPPVPALPATYSGTSLSQADAATSPSTATSSSIIPVSRATSTSSIKMAAHRISTGRRSPSRRPAPEEIAGPIPSEEDEAYFSYIPETGMAVTTPPAGNDKKRTAKTARFAELEPVAPHTSDAMPTNPSTTTPPVPRLEVRTTITPTYALPTMFDEASLPRQPALNLPQKRGKLSKHPSPESKPVKKHRWSIRSSKQTAVAV